MGLFSVLKITTEILNKTEFLAMPLFEKCELNHAFRVLTPREKKFHVIT